MTETQDEMMCNTSYRVPPESATLQHRRGRCGSYQVVDLTRPHQARVGAGEVGCYPLWPRPRNVLFLLESLYYGGRCWHGCCAMVPSRGLSHGPAPW